MEVPAVSTRAPSQPPPVYVIESIPVAGDNGVTPAEMAKVLGGDPANYQQPPQKGPLGVDIHKPVEEKTASQLVQALSGQGPSRADLEKERVPNRQAVLIHYPSQAISREVKALVESRKEWRTGAVQVLFILWNNG